MTIELERLRIAARTLRKQPVFSAVVILSLGLAIAMNTTMYGMLDALIHPRTDIRNADGLFWLQFFGNGKGATNPERDVAVRDGAKSIAQLAYFVPYYRMGMMEHGNTGVDQTISGVGRDFFSVLDGRLVAGRTFVATDQFASTTPIVISEPLANQLMPGRRNVLGERIKLGDSAYVVIGVLSRYTTLPDFTADAFVLAPAPATGIYSRIIRMRPGATPQQTNAQLDLVSARMARAAGVSTRDMGFRIHPVYDPEYHYQGFHLALVLAVTAVLLVACANVANMQLARGVGRRRELALRSALGATRRRIVGHLLLEAVILASIGLALGLVLTAWATLLLHSMIPPAVGKVIVEPQWSWRVFLSAIVATLSCIVLVGVAPSISVSRVDPNELLKSGNGTGATRKQRRQYGYLVVAEVALALFLLNGAAALVRAAATRAYGLVNGFDTTPLALAGFWHRLDPGKKVALGTLMADAVVRARATPGVANAVATSSQATVGDSITIADSASGLRMIPAPLSSAEIVTPGYLRTLDLPLIRGRDFIEGERDTQVALIDDFTAMSLWPNGNPIGALIKMGAPHTDVPYARIIGVFGYRGTETRHRYEIAELNGKRIGHVVMLPRPTDSIVAPKYVMRVPVLVRSASKDATKLPLALRRAGFSDAATYDDRYGLTRERQTISFVTLLFVAFAVFGLGLAAFGVYGVVAHSIAERRRELGVRVALGATARDILYAVLRETVVIGLAGVAAGLLATKYGVQALGTLALDEIYNAPLFAGAALFLLGVAATSALLPALRATRIDPTESLRSE